MESMSSIWLTSSLSQSLTDMKSRSRVMTDVKSRSKGAARRVFVLKAGRVTLPKFIFTLH